RRAYRYRFYPTPEQVAALARTFGCAHSVYNWALRLRSDAFYERHDALAIATRRQRSRSGQGRLAEWGVRCPACRCNTPEGSRIHARMADQRLDGLHDLTTRLIRESDVICVEALAVKPLVSHPRLAKRLGEAGWGELVRQLEYKAAWYGRTLI